MRNPFFAVPRSDEPATLANGLFDALGGIVIVAFILVGALWAPEIAEWVR
jgi:hypothetical protein